MYIQQCLPEKQMAFTTISRRAEESLLIPKSSSIISKPIPVPFHKALSISGNGSVLGGMCARASNKYGASAALLHNYEIEGILGEGGSGIVVSARRKDDCRNVAVKFIRKVNVTHSLSIYLFIVCFIYNSLEKRQSFKHYHSIRNFSVKENKPSQYR